MHNEVMLKKKVSAKANNTTTKMTDMKWLTGQFDLEF